MSPQFTVQSPQSHVHPWPPRLRWGVLALVLALVIGLWPLDSFAGLSYVNTTTPSTNTVSGKGLISFSINDTNSNLATTNFVNMTVQNATNGLTGGGSGDGVTLTSVTNVVVVYTNNLATTNYVNTATNNLLILVNSNIQSSTNNILATATNSFDPLGAAQIATNTYPWSSLYDTNGSALNATNAFASGELLTATNNVLATAYNLALSNVVYLETNSIILTNNGNYNGLCVTNLTNASSINFIAGGTITSTTLGQSLTLNTAASSSSSSGNISISPGNSTYVSGNGGSITLTPGSGNGANGGGGSLTLNGGNSGDGDYSGGQISLSGGNHASSSQGTIAIKGAGGGSGTGGGSVTISGGAAGSVATSGNVTINTPNTTTPGIITIEAGSSKGMTFTSTYVSNNLPLVQINTMSIAGALGVSNVVVTNNITVNGTNTTGYYIGNGAGLTNIPTGNISGLGSAAFQNTSFFDLAGTGTAAAQAVTNGYPWGTLYDSSGAALAATNAFASGELVSATNNLLIVATNATNLIGSLPQYPRVQIATNAPFAGAVLTSSDGTNRVWSGQLNNIITNIGATNYFISTNIQNIGGLTGIIFTNTFGTPPPAMRVVLVCVTANNGYHVGDEVNFEGAWNQDFAEPECATFASSTNFGANFPEAINQSAPGIWVGNFNLYNLPNGWTNWNLKLYAMWGSGGSYALLTPTNGMTGSDVTNTIQALADTTGTAQSATNNLLTTANGNIQSATNNLLATASNSFRQTLFTGWGDVTYNSKTETAVYSVTIPANMLNANGNAIVSMHEYKCSFGGQNFFTTNRFWFGTTNYLTTAFPAASSGGEYITTLYFIRTNSTTARVAETLAFHAVSGYTSGNVPDDQFVDVTNLNFAQANTFQITAALSTNYLATTIFKWAKIEFVP